MSAPHPERPRVSVIVPVTNKLEIGIRHNVDLDQLAAERASVTLSGSGDAKLAVSKALDVTLIGGAPA